MTLAYQMIYAPLMRGWHFYLVSNRYPTWTVQAPVEAAVTLNVKPKPVAVGRIHGSRNWTSSGVVVPVCVALDL